MSESKNSVNENDQNNDVVEVRIKAEPDVIEIKDDDDISELEHLRKLFIGGLAPYTNETSLKNFYSQFGNVVDVVVMRDPTTKRSRGFGFVTFSKSKMVDLAQSKRPHVVDGKTVDSKRALQRPDRESRDVNVTVKKLFVGGLRECHDEDNLKEHFSKFGKVISVKLLVDKNTGKRRGFAFVEYDDYDSVDKAMIEKVHLIKKVVVDVKRSVYKQEQKNRQQNRFDNGSTMNNFKNQMHNSNNGSMPNVPHQNQMQKPPQVMPPPPMNGFPPGPPPNFNYFGPPPPVQPYGNGYQQGPQPHPPPNHWNYGPAPNNWQQPPPPNGWQPNNWGYGPPQGPPAPAWNGPPVPQTPPASHPPPVQQNIPPQTHPQPPPNFGTGYQQNYGGGPEKHAPISNRGNPYDRPNQVNAYGNNTQAPPPGYSMNAVPAATPVPPVGGNYRR